VPACQGSTIYVFTRRGEGKKAEQGAEIIKKNKQMTAPAIGRVPGGGANGVKRRTTRTTLKELDAAPPGAGRVRRGPSPTRLPHAWPEANSRPGRGRNRRFLEQIGDSPAREAQGTPPRARGRHTSEAARARRAPAARGAAESLLESPVGGRGTGRAALRDHRALRGPGGPMLGLRGKYLLAMAAIRSLQDQREAEVRSMITSARLRRIPGR